MEPPDVKLESSPVSSGADTRGHCGEAMVAATFPDRVVKFCETLEFELSLCWLDWDTAKHLAKYSFTTAIGISGF